MRSLVVCALLASAAFADEGADKEESRRLTELGTRAYQAGDHQAALALFEKAERTFPSPNFAYNRGLALAGLQRTVEAVEAFEAFLRDAPDAPAQARAHAQARIDELGKLLGTIEVSCDAPGASVSIDGRAVPLGRPARVLAGPHLVAVRAPGRKDTTQDVVVDA